VLACVALGIYFGRSNSRLLSLQTRVQGTGFWESITFLLNCFAFILIGLQLPHVVQNLGAIPWTSLLGYALGVSLATILARIAWIFPATYIPRWLSLGLRAKDPSPPWQPVAFLSWAGMRGIVSLAAALALPQEFPQRDLVIFLAFAVILATLVGQGLSLPWLVRKLGLEDDGSTLREEHKARLVAAKAGLERLEQLAREDWVFADHVEDMRQRYQKYQTRYASRYRGEVDEEIEAKVAAFERLRRELIEAELEALIRLRDQGVINDGVLWDMQWDLDLERLRLGMGTRR
jgi:NhaP-type Na+/H+ or K+/H+ antiporter